MAERSYKVFSVFKYLNNKMGFLAAYVLMKTVGIEKKNEFPALIKALINANFKQCFHHFEF